MFNDEKLKKIADFWEGDNWTTEKEKNSLWPKDYYSKEAQEIEQIFWDNLIKGNDFDYDAKKILIKNGYRVFASSRDSFGLLTVCVSKDEKTFSFG